MSKPPGSKKYTGIWNGLWEHKHAMQMGTAVFLYGELLKQSKGKPVVTISYKDLQESMGSPLRTLQYWMAQLKKERPWKKGGYISVKGKNQMVITIDNYRNLKDGKPQDIAVSNTQDVAGQENIKPQDVAGISQDVAGPVSVTPLKTDASKPFLKDKKKRESLSLKKSSNSKPKNGKKTNPEVTIIRCHFYKEFEKTHGYEPYMDGKHSAIFKRLLEGDEENGNPPIRIEELKELITKFFVLRDGNIFGKRHPVEWLPGQINALRGKKKQSEELEVAL